MSEDSTPTSSDDSSGSVGSFQFNIPGVPEPHLLVDEEVTLRDTSRGYTLGYVTSASEYDNGQGGITCASRLGRLNVYDVQSAPFSGTLGNAFRYYASLGGQTVDVLIDDSIASRQVAFPGWYGELWFHLKQMAAAQDCEVALVSGIILLRPLRQREAIEHRDITRGRTYGGTTLAKAVEVNVYQNRPIENELVYPPGGWTPEVQVLTVGAGEEIAVDIELGASLSYFQPPVIQTFVGQGHSTSSVYTVVGDDGLPIQPSQWEAFGGRVDFTLNKDTSSITVTMRGATGIQSTKGQFISTFSLALGSDFTGNRYSTLRIIGTGVAFNKETLRCRTTVPDGKTGTDVGITIDNPFISTWGDAYAAGTRAARWYAGEKMILDGSLTSLNQLGDSGVATYPKYQDDQDTWQGQTYGQVQAAETGRTYGDIQSELYDLVKNDFDNQVFGNTGGSRVWDRKSHRWYRVRTGTTKPGNISISAEDDLLYGDFQEAYGSLTYELEALVVPGGGSYSRRDRMGLRKVQGQQGLYPGGSLNPSPDLFPGWGQPTGG